MRQKKYFDTLREAKKSLEERRASSYDDLDIYKMPKGTRHPGKYVVCDYMQFINTY